MGDRNSTASAGTSADYAYESTKKAYQSALEDNFRPEFLNRLDEIIVFRPLEREDLRAVVRLEFGKIAKRVQEQGIILKITDTAADWLLREGYNPKFGARPIRRTIEQKVEDHLSEAILKGEFSPGTILVVDTEPGLGPADKPRLAFRREESPQPTVTPDQPAAPTPTP